LLRSLQEIQPDFEDEAKAYAGLYSQEEEEKEEVWMCMTLKRLKP
jgi:hypothetical protein